MKYYGRPSYLRECLSKLSLDEKENYTLAVRKGRVEEGTSPQNRIFHALLREAWVSGVFSDSSPQALKERIKIEHGEANFRIDHITINGETRQNIDIESWAKMSKEKRTLAIGGLIQEMMELGATGHGIDKLIKEHQECQGRV